MFRYKTLRHEILLFGFFSKFLFIFEHISSIHQLQCPKMGPFIVFFFLKCFDLLNFSNFEIKLMNKKRNFKSLMIFTNV